MVLGFLAVVCTLEQLFPAQRRSLFARGHLLDLCYAVFYALLVIPLIVLLGAGFAGLLARAAPWLVLPRVAGAPGWCFVALAVIGIDAVDWLTHLANHRLTALWRLHAVHHSQEELSILTTYRAHPLVHVSFLLSGVPVLAVAGNTATPAVVFTLYACLGALPHANLRWTYGRARRVLISPAYHRIHHSATGRLDINLGTVFAVWDAMSRRAVFPARDPAARTVIETGLAGRPIPVEQASHRAATQPGRSPLMWILYIADAGLLVTSGLIHLHLWDIAYRQVATLDVLFLVQTVLCLLTALVLLITRHLLVVLAAAALMAGTMVGFILARSVGIFGFHLTFSSGLAWTVLIVEAAGLILLLLTAALLQRQRP